MKYQTLTYWLRSVLASIAVLVGLRAGSADAAEYQYIKEFNDPAQCTISQGGQLGLAGYMDRIEFYYNSITHRLRLDVSFEPCQGYLPDGFWLVLNGGPNPKGHSGELAIMYFDASNLAAPEVSIYAYNGQSGDSSFRDGIRNDGPTGQPGNQTPDRILSSLVSTDWIFEKSVTDGTTRDFVLDIDAGPIQDHLPLYPDPVDDWTGAQFADHIGIWFHPVSGMSAQYCVDQDADPICLDVAAGQVSTGYLKSFGYVRQGYYDIGNHLTNDIPYCLYVLPTNGQQLSIASPYPPGSCIEIDIGERFSATIIGSDGDNNSLTVDYTGVPASATVTPDSGTVLPVPAYVNFQWMPEFADNGISADMEFTFSDNYGGEKLCKLSVCVPPNSPPTCDLQALTPDPVCGGEHTLLDYTASGSSDVDHDDLTFAWETTCLDANGNPAVLVTSNGELDAQLDLTLPGTGLPANCSVSVTVRDIFQQESTCELPVDVPACDLDCLGHPNGSAELDMCGVCNGSNECLDCAGVPFGDKTIDECGVCGGDNSCVEIDCNGVPDGGATMDSCGVCGGDGLSCVECNGIYITEIQTRLDGGAKIQEAAIDRSLRLLRKPRGRNAIFVDEVKAKAHVLQIANWQLSWQFPNIIETCTNSPQCVSLSNLPRINEYEARSIEIREFHKSTVKKVIRKKKRILRRKGRLDGKHKRRIRRYRKSEFAIAKELHETNMFYLAQVPVEYDTCTPEEGNS